MHTQQPFGVKFKFLILPYSFMKTSYLGNRFNGKSKYSSKGKIPNSGFDLMSSTKEEKRLFFFDSSSKTNWTFEKHDVYDMYALLKCGIISLTISAKLISEIWKFDARMCFWRSRSRSCDLMLIDNFSINSRVKVSN